MAVTFARTGFTWGSGSGTATAPSGSGGVVVMFLLGKNFGPTLDTPGDWTSLGDTSTSFTDQAQIYAYITDVASPDYGFSFSDEAGAYCYRISDGTLTGYTYSVEAFDDYGAAKNPANIASSPDGELVCVFGMQGSSTSTNSLSLTEDYDGNIGGSGWSASDVTAASGTVSPGGGSFDPGTWTMSSANSAGWAGVIVPIASSGTTGTSATTLARATAAGSGSTTAPATSGSGAVTTATHVAAGSGSSGTTGTSATTLVRYAGAGSGFVQNSGTGAVTTATYVAAGSGSAVAPSASGSGAVTTARDTAAGSGSAVGLPVTQTTALSGATWYTSTSDTAPGFNGLATVSTSTTIIRMFKTDWASVDRTAVLEAVAVGDRLIADGSFSMTVVSVTDNTTYMSFGISGSPPTGTSVRSFTFYGGTGTLARHAAAGSGSNGSVASGTGAVTTATHVAAGSGSTVQPGTSGSGTLAPARHSVASTGSTGASGAAAVTTAGHTAAGSGTTTAPVTGTGAVTTATHTAAGSGGSGEAGTGTGTTARHTAAGAGQTGTLGSGTLTTGRCTASGTGSTVAPNTPGSGAPSTGPHTAAGAGSTGTAGTGALTLARHTIVGLPPVTGSAALTLTRLRVYTAGPAKGGLATPRPILTRLSAAQKREALRTFDTTRWLDVSFSGSWVNVVNQPNVQYSRAQGRVYLRGQASGGTGEMFILPKKFRPPQTIQKFVGTSQYQITNAGVVSRISGTGTAYMDMDFSVRG